MRTYGGKCMVAWGVNEKGEDYWKCTYHALNCNREFKPTTETCYHYRCPGRRGKATQQPEKVKSTVRILNQKTKTYEVAEPVKEKPKEVAICAWFRCDKPVAPNKLRHCSEVCRKRQNRWDYKQRQKAKKNNENAT